MKRGFWWFLFVCVAGTLTWAGNKVVKIETTEARVTEHDKALNRVQTVQNAQAADIREYKTTVRFIEQSLYRLENNREVELRNARLKRESEHKE